MTSYYHRFLLERAWARMRAEWKTTPFPPSSELFAEAYRRDQDNPPIRRRRGLCGVEEDAYDTVVTSLLLGRWPV